MLQGYSVIGRFIEKSVNVNLFKRGTSKYLINIRQSRTKIFVFLLILFMKFLELFQFAKSGVYCIRCLQNNKVYIGESGSLLERAARHFSLLKNGYHESALLQKDFLLYGSKFFQFEIIYFEKNAKKRRLLEQELIQKQLPKKCYSVTNGFKTNQLQLSQQISINGKIYDSIKQAEQFTKLSKSSIIRRLNNPDDSKYIRLQKQLIKRGKYNFIIDKMCYSSTHEVINKGLAKNDNQVREKCRSKSLKWKTWYVIQK